MKIGQALHELSQQPMQEQNLLSRGLSDIKDYFKEKPSKPKMMEDVMSNGTSLGYDLIEAARVGDTKTVESLLKSGANVHADDDSALKTSVWNNQIEVAKVLLDGGADIHADDDWALIRASREGHTGMVKLLLDRGADIHADDDSALTSAASEGNADTVKLLLDRGANGGKALSTAAWNGHTDTVKFLLERNANPHADDDWALKTAAEQGTAPDRLQPAFLRSCLASSLRLPAAGELGR